ncbi:hypothetical protein [Streptomyces sp. SCR1-8]|uniref:hypothetical protein n=1 Tax=Streptomyces TaxID=1883 RepID=UPI003FCD53D1
MFPPTRRKIQRRDGCVSQVNWTSVTLLSVETPPATVMHLPVCALTSWNELPFWLVTIQRREGCVSQLNWTSSTLLSVETPPATVAHLRV